MIRLRLSRPDGSFRLDSLAGVYRRFWPLLRKSKGILAGAVASTLAFTILTILRPWPLKLVLDNALVPEARSGVPSYLAGLSGAQIVAVASVLILVIAGLAALAGYGQRYLGAKAAQLLVYRLRQDLFRHIMKLTLTEHDRARTGDLVLRLTGDMSLLRNLLVRATLKLLSQALVVVGSAALLVWLDWRLGVAALAVVPWLAVSASRSSRRIKEAVRKQRRRESEIATATAESVGSITLVKLHGAEEVERARFQSSHRRSLRTGLRATRLQAALERRVEILVALGTCLVLWIGAHRVLAGAMTAGELVLAIAYLGMLYKPMRTFSRLTGRLAKGVVAAERVTAVLGRETENLHRPGALRPDPIEGRLQFDDVWFEYEPGRPALRGVDLVIEPGERVALVGRSGAGKTTVARLIPRLAEPTRGSITLDRIPLEAIELAHLRDRIAFVLQETVLLGVSVWDNIAYGLDALAEEDVENAARRAGIHDRIANLPDGYRTILGERGKGLSGGERQRLALARAFARPAPIVVLDEPDTHLDARARTELRETVGDVTHGRTAICIVHDVRSAQFADRIVVLDEGRVVGTGTHDELLAECETYRNLFALPLTPEVHHASR